MQNKLMLAAAMALALSAGAQAAAGPPVQAHALEKWVHEVDAQLLRGTEQGFKPLENDTERGTAVVGFTRGADGKAAGVRLIQSSGHKGVDADAVGIVKRLHGISPLPAGVAADQKILAELIFDTDYDSPKYMKAIHAAAQAEAAAEARIEAAGQIK